MSYRFPREKNGAQPITKPNRLMFYKRKSYIEFLRLHDVNRQIVGTENRVRFTKLRRL